MEHIRDDFDVIFHKVIGNARLDREVSWVEDAFVDGTPFDQAYADFWKAREHLCERFGIDWEDADLELFMNGILHLQKDLAQRMFYYGMMYAEKGYKL